MSSHQSSLQELWTRLRNCGPIVQSVLDHLAPRLIEGRRLGQAEAAKKFNDPIWKTITLQPVEVALLDMRLMQRLRRVRQLGLANLVYPSAQHSRFEHSLGALYVADRVARSVDPQIEPRFLNDIRIAALLHDCGHTAFSHVGEAAIRTHSALRTSFEAAKEVLHTHFKDPVRYSIQKALGKAGSAEPSAQLTTKGPPVAELISAILILSPAMRDAGQQMQLHEDDLLRAASLVLGRPYDLISKDNRWYLDYIKSIVSSDLDADKLDYVARDAYFAGVPVAADAERLMSQLILVDHKLDDDAMPDRATARNCRILAVLPSGVASIEIFIMTRAYLFNRVYQHPKIRLVEALLQRRLHQAIQRRLGEGEITEDGANRVPDMMYGINGDDACLELLDSERGDAASISEQWRRPRRALALSPRLVHGYDRVSGQPSRLLAEAWSLAATQIQQNPSYFEAAIGANLNVPATNIVVDWQRQANIKEDPAIFVADQFSSNNFVPLSDAFDIGQLAAAYEDIKSVAWIFADHSDLARAAAGTAIASTNLFGIVPTKEALAQAKINLQEFRAALRDLPTLQLDKFAAAQVERALSGALAIPHALVKASFKLPEEDALLLAARLADLFNSSTMMGLQFQSILAAITVSGLIVEYIEAAAKRAPRHSLPIDEGEFQKDLKQWLDLRRKRCGAPTLLLRRAL